MQGSRHCSQNAQPWQSEGKKRKSAPSHRHAHSAGAGHAVGADTRAAVRVDLEVGQGEAGRIATTLVGIRATILIWPAPLSFAVPVGPQRHKRVLLAFKSVFAWVLRFCHSGRYALTYLYAKRYTLS